MNLEFTYDSSTAASRRLDKATMEAIEDGDSYLEKTITYAGIEP
ncbi:MAG: hypothetical protein ACYTX0_37580 [Nostoc sp.]